AVPAQVFVRHIKRGAFLVVLNACVSAAPGEAAFSNLAAVLAAQKIPYVLGMRFSIYDEDARDFSRVLNGQLARGVPVEEALLLARGRLAKSHRKWAVGVPV